MKKICISLLLSVSAFIQVHAGTEKPNILLIVTDEHNFRTLGCYRDQLSEGQAHVWGPNAVVQTPHIDSLAHNGAIFNRMYGSAPVCTASRGSMFTGMYPHSLGLPNNSSREGDGKYLRADVTTVADVLKAEGYHTGYVGKWHLGERKNFEKEKNGKWWQPYPEDDKNDSYGFIDNRFMFNGGHDKWYGMDAHGKPYLSPAKNPEFVGKDSYGQPIYKDEVSSKVKYTTDWLGDRTIEYIDANKDKPFFLTVSIPDPHTPNFVRAPYDKMFADLEVVLPETFFKAHAECGVKSFPEWQCPAKTGDREGLIKDIRQYFGMVKCIDDNVGRMLKKLEDEQILENTIIIFSSDHGDLLGEHARVNKGTIHEASDKVPFLVAHGRSNKDPLVPRGKVVNEAGNTTDWMPTILSLAGVDCPEVQGRDLTPLLNEESAADWNDVTFVKLGFYAAVTSRYKLHAASKGEPWFLDIQADPNERRNLIDNPEYAEIVKKLAGDLLGYMEDVGDHNDKVASKLKRLRDQ